jgi:hypothetical protein
MRDAPAGAPPQTEFSILEQRFICLQPECKASRPRPEYRIPLLPEML